MWTIKIKQSQMLLSLVIYGMNLKKNKSFALLKKFLKKDDKRKGNKRFQLG